MAYQQERIITHLDIKPQGVIGLTEDTTPVVEVFGMVHQM